MEIPSRSCFVLAVIFGAIFSGPTFITPLYKSEAIAYPANINSYSDESETEQMLQIIQSQIIVDSVIQRFNLVDHYEIDPEYPYWRSVLNKQFHDNVKIGKTPYEAISIVVTDKDPEIAAAMANAILEFYDIKTALMHKNKRYEVIQMYQKQLDAKIALIDSLKNRLENLGSTYGLIDYSVQSQEIMRGFLKTFDGSDSRNVNTKAVNELKTNIEKLGGDLLTTVEMLQHESRTYVDIRLITNRKCVLSLKPHLFQYHFSSVPSRQESLSSKMGNLSAFGNWCIADIYFSDFCNRK